MQRLRFFKLSYFYVLVLFNFYFKLFYSYDFSYAIQFEGTRVADRVETWRRRGNVRPGGTLQEGITGGGGISVQLQYSSGISCHMIASCILNHQRNGYWILVQNVCPGRNIASLAYTAPA